MSSVLARPLDTRTIALSVAGLLAVGVGAMTYNYLASVGHTNAPSAQRTIIVAARTIPAHVTITPEMLTRVSRPADAVDPDVLSVPAAAIGSSAVNEIPAGSQVTASKLVHYATAGLPGKVHVGMRAVSIALDRVKGVSNLVQAGDLVDVIAATPRTSEAAPKAVTIIRAARVLSVGSMTEAGATPSPDASQQFASATLEVTAKQADLLTLADVNTTLRLALRSPRESQRSQPVEKLTFANDKLPPAPKPAVAPNLTQLLPQLFTPLRNPFPQPAQPQAKPTPQVPAVSVIDGDKVVSGNPR
jgi:pilus assembly protein CpaB